MKKWLKWLLITFIIGTMLTMTVSAASVWDGDIASKFGGGSGTKSRPYKIANAEQLAYLAKKVNGGEQYEGTYFVLTADIWLNDTENFASWTTYNSPDNEWTSIGVDHSNSFRGIFDGDGYTVYGMYINDNSTKNQGLFGYTKNAIIKNLHVNDAFVYGGEVVGILCGEADDTVVQKCTTAGKVYGTEKVGGICGYSSGASITWCTNHAQVTCSNNYTGGIAGYNLSGATITFCVNYGNVKGSSRNVGGIAGYGSVTIANCYNEGQITGGSVTGGIAGNCDSAENCGNAGKVSGSGRTGGVVGSMISGSLFNCWSTGTITGTSDCGGVAGYLNNCTVSNVYYLKSSASYPYGYYSSSTSISGSYSFTDVTSLTDELNKNIDDPNLYMPWTQHPETGAPYLELRTLTGLTASYSGTSYAGAPLDSSLLTVKATYDDGSSSLVSGFEISPSGNLKVGSNTLTITYKGYSTTVTVTALAFPLDGSGTKTDPYLIADEEDLLFMAQMCATDNSYLAAYWKQIDDVELTGELLPIANKGTPFSGQYDGGGYAISGFELNATGLDAALFGTVSGKICNLTMKDGSVTGSYFAGGIVSTLDGGTVENCVNYLTIKATNTSASSAGGIVAFVKNNGNILNCTNYGSVSGKAAVGGITGMAVAKIQNCTNYGAVTNTGSYTGGIAATITDGDILDCVNHAVVTTTSTSTTSVIGGIVSTAEECNVHRCSNYGQVIGYGNVAGIVGLISGSDTSYCANYARILSSYYYAGGIAAMLTDGGGITNSINAGDISCGGYYGGGIVGSASGSTMICNVANSGNVSGKNYTGGIAGAALKTGICVCYNTGTISGYSAGALVGQLSSSSNNAWVTVGYYRSGSASYACYYGYADRSYAKSLSYMQSDDFLYQLNQEAMNDNTGYCNTWYRNDVTFGGLPVPDERFLLTVESLKIEELPSKITYQINDTPDFDGLQVTAELSDGSTVDVTAQCQVVLKEDFTEPGAKRVEVSIDDKTEVFEVYVCGYQEPIIEPGKVTMEYVLTAADENIVVVAAYNESGRMLDCHWEVLNKDGTAHTMELSFRGTADQVKVFYLDRQYTPVDEAAVFQ